MALATMAKPQSRGGILGAATTAVVVLLVTACDVSEEPLDDAGEVLNDTYQDEIDRVDPASKDADEAMERVDDAKQSFRTQVHGLEDEESEKNDTDPAPHSA